MSDVVKARLYLEASVLGPLLHQEDVTDISYNGEAVYYQSSRLGRKRSEIPFNLDQAYQLIKQLANFMNLPFTYLDAIVDMSIERYRIFAVGQAMSRKFYQAVITFAIRIHSSERILARKFIPPASGLEMLFKRMIERDYSLVIAGKVGVGKTQLQKELLMLMPMHQRVIVLDNILELDGLDTPHLDLTHWQMRRSEDFSTMVAGALRANPDWLLIAESRGEEFKEVLRSVRTGHPIITTLHSNHLDGIYERMVSMLLMHEQAHLKAVFFQEVKAAFPILIQLVKVSMHGEWIRKIAAIRICLPHFKKDLIAPFTEEELMTVVTRL